MLGAVTLNLTQVILAVIAGIPGIIGAIFAATASRRVKTTNGKTLGELAEHTRDMVETNSTKLNNATGATADKTP